MNSNKKVLLLVAHDAASANAVVGFWYKKKDDYSVKVWGKGPAIKIFKDIFGCSISEIDNFNHLNLIVTGLSGVHSNFELECIRTLRPKAKNAMVISILDIPYNLDMRLMNKCGDFVDLECLPDEIWTPKELLSESPIIQNLLVVKENPYWDYLSLTKYSSPPEVTSQLVKSFKGSYFLYVTEYVSEEYGDSLGFTEYSSLERFLKWAEENMIVTLVRTHPSESKDKYNKIIESSKNTYLLNEDGSLEEHLFYSKAVIGNMSSVFFEAILIKKPTVSWQEGSNYPINYFPEDINIITSLDELDLWFKGLTI